MVAIDTNVVVYAEGIGDDRRCLAARGVLKLLARDRVVLPTQVLGELFRVLCTKGRLSKAAARDRVAELADTVVVAPCLSSTLSATLTLAGDHSFQIFDAIILAAAAEAGCGLLLSEDMQDGFVWRGVTIANPFAESLHPLLADALRT